MGETVERTGEYTKTEKHTTSFTTESGIKMIVFQEDGEVVTLDLFFDVDAMVTLDFTTEESKEKSSSFLCDLTNLMDELDNFTPEVGA